jgi:glutamine amidotransferase-like uncharacterized protein
VSILFLKMKIALFIHQPICAVDSANGIIEALSPHYQIKLFSRDEVDPTFFDDVDVVCFPGGYGDCDRFDRLLEWNIDPIKQFLNRGGKYLGICMGAYWADTDYLGLLNGVRAVQYIKQPNSDTKRPHAKNIAVNWMGHDMNMYFYDGCALIGDETTFDTVARYRNGDPMAIIQDNVGLIGCHPEAEQHWYDSYSWMRNHYHNGTNYPLLLDFVNELYRR